MCGRFVSATPPDELANYFGALAEGGDHKDLDANFNVAPTTEVYLVRASDGHRQLSSARWGLVPFWAKDLKIGSKMINARSETVADKPAFRRAYAKRRCLIPADGFYEWAKLAGSTSKQPYFIARNDDEPLAFAGLWERWRPTTDETGDAGDAGQGGEGDVVETCTILTCAPNKTMSPIHNRMPVLLPNRHWDFWLSPDSALAELATLMQPAPDDLLVATPVTTAVNNVRNNGAHLIDPAPPDDEDAAK